MHPTPWLALDGLRLGYGAKTVVEHLALHLPRGTIGCLLGPSGCGKTTVLRAVAGFEAVRGGEIRLDGQIVSSTTVQVPPEQRRIGMVFQDHALFPHLTVAANVGFGLRGHPHPEKRVAEMLDTVGLGHTAQRYPHELSGGQQQRVALARALAPSPRLMLLDEPFSSLDIELRERLGAELRSLLKAAGTTALLVTHDQHEAFAIADEIGVMHQGRIQQWAGAYQLYHEPANRFVADFVGQGAFLPGEGAGRTPPRPHRAWRGTQRPADPLHRARRPVRRGLPGGRAAAPGRCGPRRRRADPRPRGPQGVPGAEFLYTLALDSGAQVLSLVPSHHNHAVGEAIGIRLELAHVVAYQRERGGVSAAA